MVELWGAVAHLVTKGGVEWVRVLRLTMGDSKAKREEKWGGANSEGWKPI